jgi:hypothetical protein
MKSDIKTVIRKGNVITRNGWCFEVYYGGKTYPNFISALYKTKRETMEKRKLYLDTGKFDWYGSAE